MASAKTLIRSGRCVVLKDTAITLQSAMPMAGKVTIVLPVFPQKAEAYEDELRKALVNDEGRRYNQILAIWLFLARRAMGLR